jgi:hypothetical protein
MRMRSALSHVVSIVLNENLQVDANGPVRTNNDVRAYATVLLDIAHWVGNVGVRAIVEDCSSSLLASGTHDFWRIGKRCGASGHRKYEQKLAHAHRRASRLTGGAGHCTVDSHVTGQRPG